MAWKVTQELEPVTLGNKSLCITVELDGKAFGRLQIGKASLVWCSKNKQKGKKLDWCRIAQLFEEHGTDV